MVSDGETAELASLLPEDNLFRDNDDDIISIIIHGITNNRSTSRRSS